MTAMPIRRHSRSRLACTLAWCCEPTAQETGKEQDDALDRCSRSSTSPARTRQTGRRAGEARQGGEASDRKAEAAKNRASKAKPDSTPQAKRRGQAAKPADRAAPVPAMCRPRTRRSTAAREAGRDQGRAGGRGRTPRTSAARCRQAEPSPPRPAQAAARRRTSRRPAQGPGPRRARTRSSTSSSRSWPARSGRRSDRAGGGERPARADHQGDARRRAAARQARHRRGHPGQAEADRQAARDPHRADEAVRLVGIDGHAAGQAARPEARRPAARPDARRERRGAPPRKPAKPSDRHALAGGKDDLGPPPARAPAGDGQRLQGRGAARPRRS